MFTAKTRKRSRCHADVLTKSFFVGAVGERHGLVPDINTHLERNYFDKKGVLEPEVPGEYPPDRERARDVVHYKWNGNVLELTEEDSDNLETVVIGKRNYSPAEQREYKRTPLLRDHAVAEYIAAILRLVPPEKRHVEGTVGVNFFRTRTGVVSGWHKDEVEYLYTQVVEKSGGHGDGKDAARSGLLYGRNDSLKPSAETPAFTSKNMGGGDFIFHNDQEMFHNVTPLDIPVPPGKPGVNPFKRDVVVCSIDPSPAPLVEPGTLSNKEDITKVRHYRTRADGKLEEYGDYEVLNPPYYVTEDVSLVNCNFFAEGLPDSDGKTEFTFGFIPLYEGCAITPEQANGLKEELENLLSHYGIPPLRIEVVDALHGFADNKERKAQARGWRFSASDRIRTLQSAVRAAIDSGETGNNYVAIHVVIDRRYADQMESVRKEIYRMRTDYTQNLGGAITR